MSTSTPYEVTVITNADSKFRPLFQFRNGAKRLYTIGRPGSLELLLQLPARGLGIVGTRAMAARTKALIRKTVRELSGQEVIVVSGFARGVDRAAHEAALDYGLPTVAIIGSGFDCLYPPEHGELRDRILESGGLLISEHPPGTPARPYQFLNRNRLIAQWSSAVWIAQAGFRSGALNTAAWANDANVTVFATPCFPGDPEFAGTQRLLDTDKARPLWGAHGLGSQWLEFASLSLNTSGNTTGTEPGISGISSAFQSEDARQLYRWAIARFQTGEPLTVNAGMEWALESGWTRERFFTALQLIFSVGKFKPDQKNQLVPQ